MATARIAPLDPPYSAPVSAALDAIMPKGVAPLRLFRTLAVNERVFLRIMAGGLLDRGSITLREREIVIDRTCARCGSEYEWGVHVAFFGESVGLTREAGGGHLRARSLGLGAAPARSSCSADSSTSSTTPGASATPCGTHSARSGPTSSSSSWWR